MNKVDFDLPICEAIGAGESDCLQVMIEELNPEICSEVYARSCAIELKYSNGEALATETAHFDLASYLESMSDYHQHPGLEK